MKKLINNVKIKNIKSFEYDTSLKEVQNADVIIQVDNNYLSYTVALRFDPKKDNAPILIFKGRGKDTIQKVRKIAHKNGIYLSKTSNYLTLFLIDGIYLAWNKRFDFSHPLSVGMPINAAWFHWIVKPMAYVIKMRKCHTEEDLYAISDIIDSYIDDAMKAEVNSVCDSLYKL